MSSRGTEWLKEQQEAVKDYSNKKRRPYSPDEKEFVLRHVNDMTILEMAVALNRTYYSVQGQITYLKKKGRLPRT